MPASHKLDVLQTLSSPIRVSFFFDDTDLAVYTGLKKQLDPLRKRGMIDIWSLQELNLAENQMKVEAITEHLQKDHILICLLSPTFFSEEHDFEREIVIQRATNRDAVAFLVRVQPLMLDLTPFHDIPVFPRGGASLGKDPSVASLHEIALETRQVVEALHQRLFLVSSPEDETCATRLFQDLASYGLQVSTARQLQHVAGFQPEQEFREAIHQANLVVLTISPATAGSASVRMQQELIADYQRPVLLFWIEGKDEEAPDPQVWQAMKVIDARGELYQAACSQVALLARQHGRSENQPGEQADSLAGEPRNPYKGLRHFTADDTRDFFGRESLVLQLVEKVQQMLLRDEQGEISARVLTVLGRSGSGKSSVVRAGLLPYLQQHDVGGSQQWIYLSFEQLQPGKSLLEALATLLAQQPALAGATALQSVLQSDSLLTLDFLARQLVGKSTRKVVLFIDQFESLFGTTISEKERKRFFDLLLAAATEPRGPLLIVLTLRADFYGSAMHYGTLYNALETYRIPVLPPEREELRHIIEQPTRLPEVQLTFEGDLVGNLLFEVRERRDSLPLLEFTLEQLFRSREGRRLTLQAYQKIGGINGALVNHANKVYYNGLSTEEQREIAKWLFPHLIEVNAASQELMRRRVTREELALPDAKRTALLWEVIERFVEARLLTISAEAETVTVEVIHEALIREWPLCKDWIKQAQERFPFQQTLREDVARWRTLGEPKERLYEGTELRKVQKQLPGNWPDLTAHEVRFLRQSTQRRRWQQAGKISVLLLFVLMVGIGSSILVLKPSWLFPASQLPVPKVGVHDSNLWLTFQGIQSPFKILQGNPATYTLASLPVDPTTTSLGSHNTSGNDAQQLATSLSLQQPDVYRVSVQIHSLQTKEKLYIDTVTLLIVSAGHSMPYPLNVWQRGENFTTYNDNVFGVLYQGGGNRWQATDLSYPHGSVFLAPGEPDAISFQVESTVVVSLSFRIQVTYYLFTQPQNKHTLTLPNIFTTVFSDQENWHPYVLSSSGDRLVPA